MTELPHGWVGATLDEISEVIAGQSPPGSDVNDNGEGVPFFQGKAEFGELHPAVRKWTTNPTRRAAAGDVLLPVRAPVGPTNLASTECAIGRGLMAVRQHSALGERYTLWTLRASEDELRSCATGSTFEAVTGPVVRRSVVPIAPRAEQERIVAAIEEAFSKLDAGDAGLRAVRKLLKRIRDAVLAAAVTGRLVPQDPTDTPAPKLLADLGIEPRRGTGLLRRRRRGSVSCRLKSRHFVLVEIAGRLFGHSFRETVRFGLPRPGSWKRQRSVTGPGYIDLMTTAPLTPDELRRLVIEVLDRYGMSVAEFLAADVDDLESDQLRDLWLMVKGALTAA